MAAAQNIKSEIAQEYDISVNIDDNEMRVRFLNEDGVLSSYVCDAADAYAFAHKILKGYDRLEGL